jgi:dihydroorotate dehydrogenase electron transfer subunit
MKIKRATIKMERMNSRRREKREAERASSRVTKMMNKMGQGNRVTKASPDITQTGRFEAAVVDNFRLSSRYFLLVLSRPRSFPDPEPGSFLHVGIPFSGRFFLRRPFSVFDCDEKTITLLIVEKGEGTQILRELVAKDALDFLGPVGSAFPPPTTGKILAVTGGVGLAPLYYYPSYWARRSKRNEWPADFQLIYGGRTKEDLFLSTIDLCGEKIHLATEDGSHGFAGNCVELAENVLSKSSVDAIFSCGPTPMLKVLSGLAVRCGIPHWVSLENRMACAMGACRSCVIPVHSGYGAEAVGDTEPVYKTVCHDGPVFNADEIVWESIPEP